MSGMGLHTSAIPVAVSEFLLIDQVSSAPDMVVLRDPAHFGCRRRLFVPPGRVPQCDFLDSKYVVFGRVIDGLLVVRKMEVCNSHDPDVRM